MCPYSIRIAVCAALLLCTAAANAGEKRVTADIETREKMLAGATVKVDVKRVACDWGILGQ